MLDVQTAVFIFKTDPAIRDMVKLAAKLGEPVKEKDIVKYIEYLNKNVETKPEEVFYYVYVHVVNNIVYGLQKYVKWAINDSTAIAYHLLEDSNAHIEAKAIWKYYLEFVYDWAVGLGEEYME